jgi:putative ABC transport system substrate-binding protein
MDRRAFLGNLVGGLLAAPLAARAQPTGRVYRIGMLETISIALNAAHLDAFRQGLRELGYVEGQNVVIEYRSADGRQERFPELAMELVRLKVDLIVTTGTPAALAAKNAAGTIPVVIAGVGGAQRLQRRNIRETGRAAERAGSETCRNRGSLQYEQPGSAASVE